MKFRAISNSNGTRWRDVLDLKENHADLPAIASLGSVDSQKSAVLSQIRLCGSVEGRGVTRLQSRRVRAGC